jgi:hypothetical protein
MIQTEIDFTNCVHGRENNRESQQILEDQYERLNNNCRRLYDALKSGGAWSGHRIIHELNMIEYRRRIKDLREAGIFIKQANQGQARRQGKDHSRPFPVRHCGGY